MEHFSITIPRPLVGRVTDLEPNGSVQKRDMSALWADYEVTNRIVSF